MKKTLNRLLSVVLIAAALFSWMPRIAAQTTTDAPVGIADMDIAALQQAVDDGVLTYTQIMTLYLDRIETYAEQYECLITVNPDALALAASADEIYARSGRTSMLFGLPVILKDNIDVVGMPTTAGSRALAESYPKQNAPVAQALLDAGAIVVAKSNMDLFALNAHLSASDYGTVNNAYDTAYTAYGSSGGSAVSVSLSLCAGALGTDTNSSARLPAAANGIYALRPTLDVLSTDGILPYDHERDTAAPMARSVSDLAALYGTLAGQDYSAALTDVTLAGLKVGVIPQISGLDGDFYCDPEVADCFAALLETLQAQDVEVVMMEELYESPYSYIPGSTMTGWTFAAYFDEYVQGVDGPIGSFSELSAKVPTIGEYNNGYTVEDVLANDQLAYQNERKDIFADYLLSCMDTQDVDLILFPSMRNKVSVHETAAGLYNNTRLFAPATGFPELSMPAGLDTDGLPIGLELLARPNAEALLLGAANALTDLIGSVERPDDAADLYEAPAEVAALVELYRAGAGQPYSGFEEAYADVTAAYNAIGDWFAEYGSYTGDRAAHAAELSTALMTARAAYETAYIDYQEQSTFLSHTVPWLIALGAGGLTAGGILLFTGKHKRKQHNKLFDDDKF